MQLRRAFLVKLDPLKLRSKNRGPQKRRSAVRSLYMKMREAPWTAAARRRLEITARTMTKAAGRHSPSTMSKAAPDRRSPRCLGHLHFHSRAAETKEKVKRQGAKDVGAPLVGALHKGTHEGCPCETRCLRLCRTAFIAPGRRYAALWRGKPAATSGARQGVPGKHDGLRPQAAVPTPWPPRDTLPHFGYRQGQVRR